MGITANVSGFFEGYTVSELERLILWHLGQVLGTTVSFDRFPKWLIRTLLNDRQLRFVSETHCLRKYAICAAKKGYRNYKLPANCVDNGVIAVRYYQDSDTYEDMDLTDLQTLDQEYDGWKTADNTDVPTHAYQGETYGNRAVVGIYPPPDNDGDDYGDSPDTGVSVLNDLPAAVNDIIGTATSGNATTCGDTAVDFTDMGLLANMTVRNVTDGSSGTLKTIAANLLTLNAALTGGSANVFASGDIYQIIAGDYGVLLSWDKPERYILASPNQVTVPDDNLWIDYVPYPAPFRYSPTALDSAQGTDDQYPEIPKQYHVYLAYGVIADLLGTFHEMSKEFQRATFWEAKFAEGLTAANRRRSRPFHRKPVSFAPRMRG